MNILRKGGSLLCKFSQNVAHGSGRADSPVHIDS